jgi:hypothetical protein
MELLYLSLALCFLGWCWRSVKLADVAAQLKAQARRIDFDEETRAMRAEERDERTNKLDSVADQFLRMAKQAANRLGLFCPACDDPEPKGDPMPEPGDEAEAYPESAAKAASNYHKSADELGYPPFTRLHGGDEGTAPCGATLN